MDGPEFVKYPNAVCATSAACRKQLPCNRLADVPGSILSLDMQNNFGRELVNPSQIDFTPPPKHIPLPHSKESEALAKPSEPAQFGRCPFGT
jgi:hypothetical protein